MATNVQNVVLQDRESIAFLRRGFEMCRAITRVYGTSYYFATQFFPREVRDGIYGVYAFARIPDEIVDDPHKVSTEDALAKLDEWRHAWLYAMRQGYSDAPVMNAIVHSFNKFGIPIEEGEAFLRSMFMDEEKSRYENYAELERYMYGSAAVIGLMVTRIVGYSSDAAFEHAKKLGYAFQLTNFLRDIKEDYDELGRVYMPADELEKFGLTQDDLGREIYDERFINFMKWQIERNRQIYREALPGIPMLAWRGRLAVRISYVLYKAILDEIERANYNVYKGRVRTTFGQKVWLSLKAMAGVYE
jgi:phytoene synthase